MLNRAARRALGLRSRPKLPEPTVRLVGGPMANWLVRTSAPVLRPDWWTTWPDSVERRWSPGRYVADGDRAVWTEVER